MKSPIARCCTFFASTAIVLIASTAVAQEDSRSVSHSPSAGPLSPQQALEEALKTLSWHEATLAKAKATRQEAERERDEILPRQTSLREALIKQQMPPESVSEVLSKLALELIDVEVELHGKQGRLEAIRRTITVQVGRSLREIDQDEAAAKLTEIIELRQVALARSQEAHKAAIVSEAELQRAQADLAEAELRLAVRKAELADGFTTLTALNEQLLETTIDVAELESRRKYISGRLVAVRPLIELGDLESRLKQINEQVTDLQHEERNWQYNVEHVQMLAEQAQQRVEESPSTPPNAGEPEQ